MTKNERKRIIDDHVRMLHLTPTMLLEESTLKRYIKKVTHDARATVRNVCGIDYAKQIREEVTTYLYMIRNGSDKVHEYMPPEPNPFEE